MMRAERAGREAWIRARLVLRVVRTEEVEGGGGVGREGSSRVGMFLAECPGGEGREKEEGRSEIGDERRG